MTIDHLYDIYRKFPVVCTDSRQFIPDSVFFALKGDNFNGNHYAQDAVKNGAAYAVVDDPDFAINEHFLLVENVLSALQNLASYHRQQLNIPVIAITGTNGKTTTKELTAAILATEFSVEFTRGNLNNHIGVPLTLLSMNEKTRIGVVEMGANHPGEIEFLCIIADPGYGLVTNMGKAHLEGFGNFDGVVKTKSELYRYIRSKGGTVFINGDNPILTAAVGRQKEIIRYGEGENCSFRGEIIRESPFLNFNILNVKGKTNIRTNLIGDYNFENAMAAAAIGTYFGIGIETVASALENYVPSNSRSQLVIKGSNTVILDAYNANPSSMRVSLANFLGTDKRRKVVILGDMLELGAESLPEHQQIIGLLKEVNDLTVYLVGKTFMQTLKPENYHTFADAGKLAAWLKEHPITESYILIKASHGIRLDGIINSIN